MVCLASRNGPNGTMYVQHMTHIPYMDGGRVYVGAAVTLLLGTNKRTRRCSDFGKLRTQYHDLFFSFSHRNIPRNGLMVSDMETITFDQVVCSTMIRSPSHYCCIYIPVRARTPHLVDNHPNGKREFVSRPVGRQNRVTLEYRRRPGHGGMEKSECRHKEP